MVVSGPRPWRAWGNSEPNSAVLYPLGSYGSEEAAERAVRSYIARVGEGLRCFPVGAVRNVLTGQRTDFRRKATGIRGPVEVEAYEPPVITRIS